jgi:hypothetical protein
MSEQVNVSFGYNLFDLTISDIKPSFWYQFSNGVVIFVAGIDANMVRAVRFDAENNKVRARSYNRHDLHMSKLRMLELAEVSLTFSK